MSADELNGRDLSPTSGSRSAEQPSSAVWAHCEKKRKASTQIKIENSRITLRVFLDSGGGLKLRLCPCSTCGRDQDEVVTRYRERRGCPDPSQIDRCRVTQMFVYVLKLRGGFWYVGRSTDFPRRLEAHAGGRACAWTRHHPLEKLHEIQPCSESEGPGAESRKTAELMWKHGAQQVRGAEFSQPEDFGDKDLDALVRFVGHHLALPFAQVRASLARQLVGEQATASELAQPRSQAPLQPRRRSADKCPERKRSKELQERKRLRQSLEMSGRSVPCGRCGCDSHTSDMCFARVDIDGQSMTSASDEDESELEAEDNFCARCGRASHSTNQCFARTAVDGSQL